MMKHSLVFDILLKTQQYYPVLIHKSDQYQICLHLHVTVWYFNIVKKNWILFGNEKVCEMTSELSCSRKILYNVITLGFYN